MRHEAEVEEIAGEAGPVPQASGGNGLVIAFAVLLLVASIAAFFFFRS